MVADHDRNEWDDDDAGTSDSQRRKAKGKNVPAEPETSMGGGRGLATAPTLPLVLAPDPSPAPPSALNPTLNLELGLVPEAEPAPPRIFDLDSDETEPDLDLRRETARVAAAALRARIWPILSASGSSRPVSFAEDSSSIKFSVLGRHVAGLPWFEETGDWMCSRDYRRPRRDRKPGLGSV